MKLTPDNCYTQMQKKFYVHVMDPIYGSEKVHNEFYGNQHLFDGLETKRKIALDFGCGLGRCVKLFKDKFKRIDGADINERYIDQCRIKFPKSKFYLTDGISLNRIEPRTYQLIYSIVTLQHIPVWSIRFNLFEEFYRVLKRGGWISIQMGYGAREDSRNYYEDYWEADGTNSKCDVRVDEPKQLKIDLEKIGFKNFKYWLTGHGPNDRHDQWIYFRAQK